MTMDKAQPVRTEDALNTDKISDFLLQSMPQEFDGNIMQILQFPGGASNLTYEIQLQDRSLIIRTSPAGANIKSAHDMGREFNVLSKLQGHFPYCPKPLAYSEDTDILGRPFYVMEKVNGIIPRKDMPVEMNKSQVRELCNQLINVHVDLHDIDIKSTGLIELGKPEGYVSRQVSGWCERYRNARTDDVPSGREVMDWLKSNEPNDSYNKAEDASFIHNDFKFDNVILDQNDPTRIISVLDWEMATVGDPLMDLGCSLAYWIEKGDSQAMQMIRILPTNIDGMMTRDEIIDRYIQKSGRQIASFDYYYVFGMFRLAVIVQQIYKRYKEGTTTNRKFASFGQIASVLIAECKKYH